MHTTDRQPWRQAIPSCGFETLLVMAEAHRLFAGIEGGLRAAARWQGMAPRIGEKLQSLHDAVSVFQVSLPACEHTGHQVLAGSTEAAGQRGHQAGLGA